MANLYIFDSSALGEGGRPLIVSIIEQLRTEENLIAVIMESNADVLESTEIMKRMAAEFLPDYTAVIHGDYPTLPVSVMTVAQRASEENDLSEAYFITGDSAHLAMSYAGIHSLSIEEFLVTHSLI